MTSPTYTESLFETAENRAAAGAVVTVVRTADGVPIRAALWRPAGAPRGTILLLQGRAEFIEKYFEVIDELLGRGFAVLAFDWRGQGGSGRVLADGRKGHIRHFADFRHDLEAVVERLGPELPRPVHGLAHSMGGCIALTAAAEGWLPVERLVATTPMIGLRLVRRPRLARMLARTLARLGLAERFIPGGVTGSISTLPFPGNRLCGDERRYARNAAVALALGAGAIGSPTIGWVDAAYEAMARFAEPAFAAAIRVPTLLIGAGDDPICSTEAIELFARSLPSGSSYLLVPGARHEVLMESDAIRAAFWTAFDAFLALPSAGSALKEPQHLGMQPLVAAGDDAAAPGR